MKKLVTHNGKYHSDDVLACATLELYLDRQGESYEIIRTRDESVIKTGDYVFDVGGVYDPKTNRFDHHQREGAGTRENTIPYAAFGLVWKHFGRELCPSDEIFNEIDLKIVSGIDALDNGISIAQEVFKDIKSIDFHDIISSFMPSWKNSSEETYLEAFLESVTLAKKFIVNHIRYLSDLEEGEQIVEKAYRESNDKKLIIFDVYCSGKDKLADYPEPLFAIFPDTINKRWMVSTVRDKDKEFVNRKDFPKEWGGLRDEEFSKVTGIPDGVFCHKGLFLLATQSKESAIKLAKMAISM